MEKLFKPDTYWNDMPWDIEGHIDAATDRHKEIRGKLDPSGVGNPTGAQREQIGLIVAEIDAQRDQIGRLFKIQAKLQELLEAIDEYDGINNDLDDEEGEG